MRKYTGEPLQEAEWLLKKSGKTGFLTKLTKKGELPKAFDIWRYAPLPIYLHTERFQDGWELIGCRIGKSQEWATLMHPDGFTVEIYLSSLMDILSISTMINKKLQGEFKWDNHKLIKK